MYVVRPAKWWSWAAWKQARAASKIINEPANGLQMLLRQCVIDSVEGRESWNTLQERVSAVEARWK